MGNNTSVKQNFAKTNINVYNSFRRDLDSSTIYKGTKKLYRLTFGQHKPLNNKDYEILKKYFSCRGRYLDEEINCDILAFNIKDIYEIEYISVIYKFLHIIHMIFIQLVLYISLFTISIIYTISLLPSFLPIDNSSYYFIFFYTLLNIQYIYI